MAKASSVISSILNDKIHSVHTESISQAKLGINSNVTAETNGTFEEINALVKDTLVDVENALYLIAFWHRGTSKYEAVIGEEEVVDLGSISAN